jgi:hypothetical protein
VAAQQIEAAIGLAFLCRHLATCQNSHRRRHASQIRDVREGVGVAPRAALSDRAKYVQVGMERFSAEASQTTNPVGDAAGCQPRTNTILRAMRPKERQR